MKETIFDKISQSIINEENKFFPMVESIEVGSIRLVKDMNIALASINVNYDANHYQIFLNRKYQLKVLKDSKESIYLIHKNI